MLTCDRLNYAVRKYKNTSMTDYDGFTLQTKRWQNIVAQFFWERANQGRYAFITRFCGLRCSQSIDSTQVVCNLYNTVLHSQTEYNSTIYNINYYFFFEECSLFSP